MTLDELHKLRERAGIKFSKSFNCIDAEKNIHLVDKDKFFEKILERLNKMGYKPERDFDFEVIRYKFPYAERHHVGQTYEWKYFYSTTFEITDDIVEYLDFHRFITRIKEKEVRKKERQEEKEARHNRNWEDVLKINERKIKKYAIQEEAYRQHGQIESADNLLRAINKCKEKIENVKIRIEIERRTAELKNEEQNN